MGRDGAARAQPPRLLQRRRRRGCRPRRGPWRGLRRRASLRRRLGRRQMGGGWLRERLGGGGLCLRGGLQGRLCLWARRQQRLRLRGLLLWLLQHLPTQLMRCVLRRRAARRSDHLVRSCALQLSARCGCRRWRGPGRQCVLTAAPCRRTCRHSQLIHVHRRGGTFGRITSCGSCGSCGRSGIVRAAGWCAHVSKRRRSRAGGRGAAARQPLRAHTRRAPPGME